MRVLIAEDDLISRKVLQSTLQKWGHEVLVTANGKEAWEQLQQDDAPKLAVLDWMMPEMTGLDVCRNVRAIPGGEYFYLLLLTAKAQKEDIVEGLEAGADDYIVKPFDSRELRVRIRCGQRIIELQSALLEAKREMEIQATHDGLTGLLNRAAIFEALEREDSRSRRENKPLSVVMLDLDLFKAVNDTFGHVVGDDVLRETSRRMTLESRAYDLVGRYGGEEFMIVLPATDSAEGASQAERLRRVIEKEPFRSGELELNVTASLGVASSCDLARVGIDDLVQAADAALYRSKEGGRNRVSVSEEAPIPSEA